MDGDHIMASILVTIQAIFRYLAKAREAKEQLDQANNEMKQAAEQLCSIWQGASAEAFAAEQGVLQGWVSEISNVGGEYMELLSTTASKYAEAEQRATNAITKV